MKIVATSIKAKDLQHGDLFSTMGQMFWNDVMTGENNLEAVGQKVYLRTNFPCPLNQEDEEIYKIEIIK